jgi:hypothetical protein
MNIGDKVLYSVCIHINILIILLLLYALTEDLKNEYEPTSENYRQ